MGLFHMRLSHGSEVLVSEAVLWKRRPAGRRKEELKNWLALRKAGRDARNMLLVGDIFFQDGFLGGRVTVFRRGWLTNPN